MEEKNEQKREKRKEEVEGGNFGFFFVRTKIHIISFFIRTNSL